ncbi:hypothetical protein BKA70DRAFT_1222096 [Coprinopsis sp. MPI-PUGE-AT-0042]|nr:hypothetical protein BKA70DRAFT_1222096 [Coprinopsis sp. MPI-PUGE-AT-0042]
MTTNDRNMFLDPLSLDLVGFPSSTSTTLADSHVPQYQNLTSSSTDHASETNVCWTSYCRGFCACDWRVAYPYPSSPVDGRDFFVPHHAALDSSTGIETLCEVLERIQWIDHQIQDLPSHCYIPGHEDEEEQLTQLEELRRTMKPPLRDTEGPWHWGYTNSELTTLREAYAEQHVRNRSPFEPLIPSHLNPKRESVPPLSWMFFTSPCSGVRNWSFHRPLNLIPTRCRRAKRNLEFKQCMHCRREGNSLHNSLVSRRYKIRYQQIMYPRPLLSAQYGRPPGLPLSISAPFSAPIREGYVPCTWEISQSEVKPPTAPRLVDCHDFVEESDSDDPLLVDDWDSDSLSDSSSEGDFEDEDYAFTLEDC